MRILLRLLLLQIPLWYLMFLAETSDILRGSKKEDSYDDSPIRIHGESSGEKVPEATNSNKVPKLTHSSSVSSPPPPPPPMELQWTSTIRKSIEIKITQNPTASPIAHDEVLALEQQAISAIQKSTIPSNAVEFDKLPIQMTKVEEREQPPTFRGSTTEMDVDDLDERKTSISLTVELEKETPKEGTQKNPKERDCSGDKPVQNTQNKPTLVIHIGPSKTGTTTIQMDSASPEWEKVLALDGYAYLGKEGRPSLRQEAQIPYLFENDDCFKETAAAWKNQTTTNFRETRCWARRMAGLDEYLRNNESIVVSDEAYSYTQRYYIRDLEWYKMFKVALQDWNVIIVPTYRRYYEWLISSVKEKNKKGCLNPMNPIGGWFHQQGEPCANFWWRIQQMMEYKNDYRSASSSYTNLDVSIPMWQEAGFVVKVLNFHDPKHITCSLYCDVITDTPSTCQFCLDHAKSHENSHSAELTAYSDLVYYAGKRGLISNNTLLHNSRANLTAELAHYHTDTLGRQGLPDLPLTCPRKVDLHLLLNRSLAFEKIIVPEFAAVHEQDHRQSFWKTTVERRELCWVYRQPLMEGKTSWDEVLEAIRNTQEWPVWGQPARKRRPTETNATEAAKWIFVGAPGQKT